MNDYFLILTNIGKAKVAEAIINDKKVNITGVAFGDGNGNIVTPTPAWTNLTREAYRTAPNSVNIRTDNNNWISVKAYIPKNVGGWFIREIGLFDSENNLIAVGNYPDTYKPTLSLGVGVDMFVEVIMEVSDAAAITLIVDPSQMLVTVEQMETFVKENAGQVDNIGKLEFSMRQDVPFGRLRCDGAIYNADTSTEFASFYDNYLLTGKFKTVSFTEYDNNITTTRIKKSLFRSDKTVIVSIDGECGYFGIDAATRQFRAPTIKNGSALTQAQDLTELGEWYDGAMQKITGRFSPQPDSAPESWTWQGAFYSGGGFSGKGTGKGGSDGYYYMFDSSRVVATADETRTRQIRYPIFVTITNATASVPVADNIWNDFLSSLNNKANIDLENVTSGVDFVKSRQNYSESQNNGTHTYTVSKWKSGKAEIHGLVVFPDTVNMITTDITFPPGTFTKVPISFASSLKGNDGGTFASVMIFRDLTKDGVRVQSFGHSDIICGFSYHVFGE
jgi:hypothetical protein